jgi:hypothetical protein
MTALADFRVAQSGPDAGRGPGGRGPGPAVVPGPVPAADRSGQVRGQARTMRSWPLLVLAVPAAAEVWSGWVGIAQQTGFGTVPLLPGIWSSLHLDTAVTLPVGVECYAAYALRAWLAGGRAVSDRTRRFARRSAICSFALGMAGQVAFHLMDQDHVTRAPWIITTLVSCLPVLVLGMGPHWPTCCARTPQRQTSRTTGPADRPGLGPRVGPPRTGPRTSRAGTGIRTSRSKPGTSGPGPGPRSGPRSGPVRLRGPATPRSRRARQRRPAPPGVSVPVPGTRGASRHPRLPSG